MDDLKFIDTLDEEQRANLSRVIDSANRYGVNPRLAAALAFTESELRHKSGDKVVRGSSGEVGIMQVKPATGKLLGFEVKQLMDDPNANIDAGMKYLRQSIDKFGDPVLGAVGYNAGPDHPFFSGKGDPPAQSVDYVNRIRAYGGFSEPPPEEEAPPPDAVEAPAEPKSDNRTAIAAGLGGIGGAALGAGRMTVGAAAERLFGRGQPSVAPVLNPQEARILQGTTGEAGTTGRARMQGFNVETAQTAARAKEAERLLEELQNRRVVAGGAKSILAQAPGLTSSPSGVLYPRGTEFPTPPPPTSSPLARAAGTVGAIAQSPIGRYGLAGAGVAGNAQEFVTRRQQEDVPGQVLSGTGALGSAMMMSRNPAILALGGGMAGVSPLALAVLDRARKVRAEPPVAPATAAEMQEAQSPVFRYARP
jgi:hypothetical protein